MLAKVEVGTREDTLYLLEAEWHVELDICSSISIVSKLVVVVEAVVLSTETEVLMPLHTYFLPLSEPVKLCTWLDEELHLHLLELTHTEDELTCNDLITECLTDLGDTEMNLHTAGLLYV